MNQISINIDVLNGKIQKLRSLKEKCEMIDVSETEVVGSGLSIDVLSNLDKEYSSIKSSFVKLLDNSILFFENIKNSMESADNEAAYKLCREE